MSLIKNTNDAKFFGKKWNFQSDRMDVVGLFFAFVIFMFYCVYLNFSAIGNLISFKTGIHPIVGIVFLFILTYIIKKSDRVFNKYVSQTMWLTMGALGMYWVVTYSNWATYEKVILVTFHMIAYTNLIMNALTSDE